MHCDDKRMMYVLKQEIEQMWTELRNSDFQNQKFLEIDDSVPNF